MDEEMTETSEQTIYYPAFLDLRGQAMPGDRGRPGGAAQGGRVAGGGCEGDGHRAAARGHAAGGDRTRGAYQPGDLAGVRLVIAATDDAAVNAAVAQEAEELGIGECRR